MIRWWSIVELEATCNVASVVVVVVVVLVRVVVESLSSLAVKG